MFTLHNDILVIKEDLNVPPMSVQTGNLGCADVEVVRDENDFFPSLLVIEGDSAYRFWIEINRLGCQADCEVTRDTRLPVCFRQCPMAEDFIPHVLLRSAYPIIWKRNRASKSTYVLSIM